MFPCKRQRTAQLNQEASLPLFPSREGATVNTAQVHHPSQDGTERRHRALPQSSRESACRPPPSSHSAPRSSPFPVRTGVLSGVRPSLDAHSLPPTTKKPRMSSVKQFQVFRLLQERETSQRPARVDSRRAVKDLHVSGAGGARPSRRRRVHFSHLGVRKDHGFPARLCQHWPALASPCARTDLNSFSPCATPHPCLPPPVDAWTLQF